jgi:hypothetical protein
VRFVFLLPLASLTDANHAENGDRGGSGPTRTNPAAPGGRRDDMTTDGIEAVFVEAHNWGQSARFFQALGYELEFDTGHSSGQLRNGEGPYVFVAEVAPDQVPRIRMVVRVPDAATFVPDPTLDVVSPFAPTHWGTQEMVLRDPDGREWSLQAPGDG